MEATSDIDRRPDDVEVTLDGRDFAMRPSFKAIYRIEERSGMGIMDMTRRVGEQKHGLRDAAIVITAGLQAAGERQANLDKVAELVFKTGLIGVYGALDRFLWRCVMGERDPAEETAAGEDPGEAPAASGAAKAAAKG